MAKQKNPSLIQMDYTMWTIYHVARDAFGALITYMQSHTEYGEAYQKAYETMMALQTEMDGLNPILKECAENPKGGK